MAAATGRLSASEGPSFGACRTGKGQVKPRHRDNQARLQQRKAGKDYYYQASTSIPLERLPLSSYNFPRISNGIGRVPDLEAAVRSAVVHLSEAPFLQLQQHEVTSHHAVDDSILHSPQLREGLNDFFCESKAELVMLVQPLSQPDASQTARQVDTGGNVLTGIINASRRQRLQTFAEFLRRGGSGAQAVLSGSIGECCDEPMHTTSQVVAFPKTYRRHAHSEPSSKSAHGRNEISRYFGMILQSRKHSDSGCYVLKTMDSAVGDCTCTHWTLTKVSKAAPIFDQLCSAWLRCTCLKGLPEGGLRSPVSTGMFDAFRPKDDVGDKLLFAGIVVALVLVAGLMSGLTLGLLSISKTDLEVLLRSGTPSERARAARIEPVLRRPHFLLVTLVLCNAAATEVTTEALPIFLDRLLDPVTAIVLSIFVVLVFGEIIPQSACSKYGLVVGANAAPLVYALMAVCAIVAWPISKLLDWVLGSEHEGLFRRAQLKALVSIHSQEESFGGNLTTDEVAIIRGALDLSSKTAANVMTPLDNVFMLADDRVLDDATLLQILGSGHSRIPIHRATGSRHEILGLLLVKDLIIINKENGVRAADVRLRGVPFLKANTNLYDILHLFESGRCHMAVLVGDINSASSVDGDEQLEEVIQVRVENEYIESEPLLHPQANMEGPSKNQTVVGIITLEDILEAIIQAEDNERLERVDAREQLNALPPHLQRLLLSRNFIPRVGPRRPPLLSSKETQNKIDVKLSEYRNLAAKKRMNKSDDGSARQLAPKESLRGGIHSDRSMFLPSPFPTAAKLPVTC